MSPACAILSLEETLRTLGPAFAQGSEAGFGVSVTCLWGMAASGKLGPNPRIILKGLGAGSLLRGFCQQGGLLCFPQPARALQSPSPLSVEIITETWEGILF